MSIEMRGLNIAIGTKPIVRDVCMGIADGERVGLVGSSGSEMCIRDRTYTFHLNQNMTFSNGDKLDADDVAWSINQLKEKQYYNANPVESLSKAEALDANTVRLTLSSPDSNLCLLYTSRCV